MRRFLKYVAIFSLLVIGVLGIGECIVRHLPNPYSFKDEWMRDHAGRVSTLVLGSSHTYYGVYPPLLGDSVFNLAQVSQTPEYDLALLRRYLPECRNLRRVIIPVSYFTFREPQLEDGTDSRLVAEYKTRMGVDIHPDLSVYNLAIYDWPAYTGRLRSLVLREGGMNRCDSTGFGLGYGLDTRDADWESRARTRVDELTCAPTPRVAQVTEVYRRMVELCGEHGVECVLITTPVWHTFREAQDPGQAREMAEAAQALSRQLGILYLNLYDDPRFVADDFHDVDHLSTAGAAKLTKILEDEGL